MTTRTLPTLPTAPVIDQGSRGSRPRRFFALVRGETWILLRNKTATFTAVVAPFAMGLAFTGALRTDNAGVALTGALVSMGLIFVIYYTLVTSLVGRREQLVLKRLHAGEPTPLEILLAPAVPLWALLVLQSAIAVGVATLLLGASIAHPWAIALAVLGGATTWTALAIWSATWTRTVESAQLTTLPLMLVALGLSGLVIPLSLLPRAVELLAHVTPMAPVLDLIHLGFNGTGTSGDPITGMGATLLAAASMLLPLVAWTGFGLWAGVRNFRWDARS